MGRSDKPKKLRLKRAEKQKFMRFAKDARKLGLLVSKEAYIRYFREPTEVPGKGSAKPPGLAQAK